MRKRLVIGITLAPYEAGLLKEFLLAQKDLSVSCNLRQPLPLRGNADAVIQELAASHERHSGTHVIVSFTYLPYVGEILNRFEGARVVCLKSEWIRCIRGLAKASQAEQDWILDYLKSQHIPIQKNKKTNQKPPTPEHLVQFRERFFEMASELQTTFPDRFSIWPTRVLATSEGQGELLDWIGLAKPARNGHATSIRLPVDETVRLVETKVITRAQVMQDTTFVITTFMRDASRDRLIESIRAFYADAKIIVVDNGPDPQPREDIQEYHVLPFDCGLSAMRNFALTRVTTPYMMLLDDDFVFTEDTRIEVLATALESTQADIVGGALQEKDGAFPTFTKILFLDKQNRLVFADGFHQRFQLNYEDDIYDLYHHDTIPNFFLLRMSTMRDHKWDENIKINGEHVDYFFRIRGKRKVLFCPHVCAFHARDLNEASPVYKKYRHRNFRGILYEKYGITDFFGITLNDSSWFLQPVEQHNGEGPNRAPMWAIDLRQKLLNGSKKKKSLIRALAGKTKRVIIRWI